MLAPTLRDELGLSLPQVGVLLAAPWIGPALTLLPWGLLADRVGERSVLSIGLGACGALTAPLAFVSDFGTYFVLLVLAGAAGASVNSASGRAVMAWFGAAERGLALGIRQTATPLGGVIAALALPPIAAAGGLRASFLFLAALVLVAAIVGGVVLRDAPHETLADAAPRLLRDRRLWLVSGSGGLYLVAQVAVTGFLVLYLHDVRGLSTYAAAAVLAGVQALAVVLRIAVGRWSDVVGNRVGPLRIVGLAAFATVIATAAALDAATVVVVLAFLVSGSLTMSWNGLSFTAAAELAGRARSGAAIGIQQTVLTVIAAGVPPGFASVVEATSWRMAFALAALFPLAGWVMLARVRV